MAVELYSGVELTEPLNGYEPGAHGNVVELLTDTDALVEFFDDDGHTIAVEDVPVRKLRMVRDARGRLLDAEPTGVA
jgi:YD repeat-containing protein